MHIIVNEELNYIAFACDGTAIETVRALRDGLDVIEKKTWKTASPERVFEMDMTQDPSPYRDEGDARDLNVYLVDQEARAILTLDFDLGRATAAMGEIAAKCADFQKQNPSLEIVAIEGIVAPALDNEALRRLWEDDPEAWAAAVAEAKKGSEPESDEGGAVLIIKSSSESKRPFLLMNAGGNFFTNPSVTGTLPASCKPETAFTADMNIFCTEADRETGRIAATCKVSSEKYVNVKHQIWYRMVSDSPFVRWGRDDVLGNLDTTPYRPAEASFRVPKNSRFCLSWVSP